MPDLISHLLVKGTAAAIVGRPKDISITQKICSVASSSSDLQRITVHQLPSDEPGLQFNEPVLRLICTNYPKVCCSSLPHSLFLPLLAFDESDILLFF